jgi:hypothetical protein
MSVLQYFSSYAVDGDHVSDVEARRAANTEILTY